MKWDEYLIYLKQAEEITKDMNLNYIESTNYNAFLASILSDSSTTIVEKIKLILNDNRRLN